MADVDDDKKVDGKEIIGEDTLQDPINAQAVEDKRVQALFDDVEPDNVNVAKTDIKGTDGNKDSSSNIDDKDVDKDSTNNDDKKLDKSSGDNTDTDTKPKIDPELQSSLDDINKRLKDTQTWGNNLNQQLITSKQQVEALTLEVGAAKDKADGTFDETVYQQKVDNLKQKVAAPQQAVKRAEKSKLLAVDIFGQEEVDRLIGNPDEDTPYQRAVKRDPKLFSGVRESESPFITAIKIAKEEEKRGKFGNTPDEIRSALVKAFETDEKPKLLAKMKEDLLGGKDKLNNIPRGLPSGGGGHEFKQGDSNTKLNSNKLLSDVFNVAG
jgi:hypothetical protein